MKVEDVLSPLTYLTTVDRFSQVVFEARARNGQIHYLLGAEPKLFSRIEALFLSELPGIKFSEQVIRNKVMLAKSVKLSRPQMALNTNAHFAIMRTILAALAQTKVSNEETILQVVLGQSFTSSLLPNKLSDPTASWLEIARGSVTAASSESRVLMKEKLNYHGL